MTLSIAVSTLVLTMALLYHNYRVNGSVLYLAACLLSVSVMTLTHYYFSEGNSPFWLAVFFTHFIPVYFLFGPFLYFYVRSVLTDRTGMAARDFRHFIPSLFFLAHIIPYLVRGWDEKLGLAADIIRDPRNAGYQSFTLSA